MAAREGQVEAGNLRAPPIGRFRSLRRLIIFQIKLAADAIRDVLLSPVSMVAYGLDILIRPTEQQSLHRRLMRLGRRTDRFINLFEEYNDARHPTIDDTIGDLETRILRDSRDNKDEGVVSVSTTTEVR